MLQHPIIIVNTLQWAYPRAEIFFLFGKHESLRNEFAQSISFLNDGLRMKISPYFPDISTSALQS